MVYSAQRAGKVGTEILSQPADRLSTPRVLYQEPHSSWLTDVSRDGRWALLVRLVSQSQTQLLLIDLATGVGRALYPAADRIARVNDARFSADGSLVYVATDDGGDLGLVLAIERSTSRERARYTEREPPTAVPEGLALSDDGASLAVVCDAGNQRLLRILDAPELRRLPGPSLPIGSGYPSDFAAGEVALEWATADHPADLYGVKPGAQRWEPLLSASGRESSPAPGTTTVVQVRSFDGTEIPVNLYLPRGPKVPLPVLVWVHGGPGSSAEVGWDPLVEFYVQLGFAVVQPNIRGSTGFGRAYELADDGHKRLDAVRDIEAIGRWAAGQPWAAPGKLAIWGRSYGGYIVLMALTRQSDLWAAGVDLFGIADLRAELSSTSGWVHELLEKEFGSLQTDGAFLDSISPIHDIDKIRAPIFIYQGRNDVHTPQAGADAIVRALRARRVAVEYMLVPNEGHGEMQHPENEIAFLARSARFLETQLEVR
ncbi:MAG: S9 family peptidase [Deltaproteobacteria bacterium]